MDLDHFKHVNDSLGHKAGDQLLVNVASRIRTSLRESDLVGRLGGDEFVIMLKNLRLNDDVVLVCQELLKHITSPFQLEGQDIYINTSIGIALYPEDGASANELIKNADAAMYLSKERGKGTFSFYTEELDQRAKKRIFLDSSLHQAVLQNQFHLLFQPQVDGVTNEVLGAEALIRWNHPTQGVISPIDFIPVAEETGLILPIGDWVMLEACRLNKAWQDQGLKPVVISINVSQKQFAAGNLVAKVDQALQASGLDPKYLKLEITESLLMQQVDHTIHELQTLRRMGIHSSIDDFGTGYSSLSYLKQFPISDLKIDQAFTRDILQDARIAQAIISLAKSLGLRVVAEGVETQEQVNYLVEKGCQVMQGYFYAKPLEAEAFARLLEQSKNLKG